MNAFESIRHEFADSLAIMILHGDFTGDSEYQKGFLHGYARAYTKITGESMYELVAVANKMIEGSGKALMFK